MSRLAHSAGWSVVRKGGRHFPCMDTAYRATTGERVASGLMYPSAHYQADCMNRRDGVTDAPTYSPEEPPV